MQDQGLKAGAAFLSKLGLEASKEFSQDAFGRPALGFGMVLGVEIYIVGRTLFNICQSWQRTKRTTEAHLNMSSISDFDSVFESRKSIAPTLIVPETKKRKLLLLSQQIKRIAIKTTMGGNKGREVNNTQMANSSKNGTVCRKRSFESAEICWLGGCTCSL